MDTKVKVKKSKTNKKTGEIIFFAILAIILVLAVYAFSKFAIISKIEREVSKYTSSTNYHIKSVAKEGDSTTVTLNYYTKNGKQVVFLERNKNGEITRVSIFNNGQRTDTFTETKNEKKVKLDSGASMTISVNNYMQTDNTWQTFLLGAFAKIKSVNYNGKACYEISNICFPNYLLSGDKGDKVYIEKATGLGLKEITSNTVTEREYEFDNVNDAIFTEPDVSQYTLTK